MKHHIIEMPNRYDRKVLYVGALILTLAILLLGFLDGRVRIESQLDEQRDIFIAQRERVKNETDRIIIEMTQLVEFYEHTWDLHELDDVPVSKYQQALLADPSGLETEPDLTVVPYSLVSSLTRPEDKPRLATYLRILRAYSPAPAVRMRDKGTVFGGFFYTTEGDFLATIPPLGEQARKIIRADNNIKAFIADHISAIDAYLSTISPDVLKVHRVVSIPVLFDPETGEKASYLAAPIFHNKVRVGAIVVRTSDHKIAELFSTKNMQEGFFIVRAEGEHWTPVDAANNNIERWSDVLKNADDVFRQTGTQLQFTHRGSNTLITQRLPDLNWIAVYIFNWKSALLSPHSALLPTLIGTLLLLLLVWAAVLFFDRHTLKPMTLKSKLLAESEAFNRIVVASAPVGLSVVDPIDFSIVVQNSIARDLLESQPENGSAFYRELIYRDTRAGMIPVADSGTQENVIIGPNGERIEIETVMSWTRLRNRNVILFSLTNISQRKQTERLLENAKKTSDQASQAKSLFLAAMSHEIRTPLHGALGNLELLARDRELLPGQRMRVDIIRHSFDALLNLINDILDLSKVEAHELKLAARPFHIVELLENCTQTFAALINDKNIRLYCVFLSPFPQALIGDSHRITQILMNLLSNAAKFTAAGSITISAQSISENGQNWLRLQISDSGCGMSAEDIKRIFQPFTQVGQSAHSNKGTGLGLALCKSLTELMHGHIRVESETSIGSIFTIDLPLLIDLEAVASPPLPMRPNLRIVVVCEHIFWRRSLVLQLGQWGLHAVGINTLQQLDNEALETPTLLLFAAYTSITDVQEAALAPTLEPSSELSLELSSSDPRLIGQMLISPRGPLYPETINGVTYISAFASKTFQAAIFAMIDGKSMAPQLPPPEQDDLDAERAQFSILVAEDDVVNSKLIHNQLNACGYTNSILAKDGVIAVAIWERQPVDLVITDLGMPNMDGIELLFALRARGATIPILAMTASAQQDLGAGLSAFTQSMHKPVTIDQLRATLDRYLLKIEPAASAVNVTTVSHAPRIIHQDLKDAFTECWQQDRAGLVQALEAQDADSFDNRLHKVYGALCILNETQAADTCQTLKNRCAEKGIVACESACHHFLEIIDTIFKRYQASAASPDQSGSGDASATPDNAPTVF
ncbi:ATP-binding protein [Herbaspirillum sp. RTI4]|uniref:hybrid sensor histidine kinase/response regulator n=1 Tax=Herbaspirillum sp. RTI4 TaxID=3048640 RepID=UPI002AB501D4|nr:ATP-binding protein [Herbaspirillum sp. RTI4]MDY7577112.1 ATP-binding protein [Herbaspirillum sp. RTI4]MEA9982854.1 ATP-binding protein [Herbaspirillum sp. RTI4]